jgi:ethanolamine-phosphate cytidylyltransferase
VRACKWVDQVVEDAPYLTSLEVMDQYNCRYCVHGDDVTTMSDGTDCYSLVKAVGRYKEYPRTEGISTTALLGRMLRLSNKDIGPYESPNDHNLDKLIDLFKSNLLPKKEDIVVYIDGSWDMFHSGHIEILERVRSFGTFVIVGIFSDQDASKYSKQNFHISIYKAN